MACHGPYPDRPANAGSRPLSSGLSDAGPAHSDPAGGGQPSHLLSFGPVPLRHGPDPLGGKTGPRGISAPASLRRNVYVLLFGRLRKSHPELWPFPPVVSPALPASQHHERQGIRPPSAALCPLGRCGCPLGTGGISLAVPPSGRPQTAWRTAGQPQRPWHFSGGGLVPPSGLPEGP